MKISFCTSCMNRLHQLAQTLPANLEPLLEDGRAELVVLNYNSQDGLDEWMKRYQSYIDSGVIRYGHETKARYFHASKAKNLAHYLATGEFLVNLDADNFIENSIPEMRRYWREDPWAVLWLWPGSDYSDGTFGRIGLNRAVFVKCGGYDEEFLPIAVQDRDLLSRLAELGYPYRQLTGTGARALRNSTEEKCAFLGSKLSYDEMDSINRTQMLSNIASGRLIRNQSRLKVPVHVNWKSVMLV